MISLYIYPSFTLFQLKFVLVELSGLDPAEPQYYDRPRLVRLDKADADYVDVIHTNGAQNGFGMRMACGDVDFYVNDGKSQPGCPGILTNIGDLLSGDINGRYF